MKQIEAYGIGQLPVLLETLQAKKYLLVCDASFPFLSIREDIESIPVERIEFHDFSSNPLHADVDKGVELFRKEQCDVIVAVGGGSSMDVAKCIKMDSGMDVPLIAIPTTAGTGSESTKHIVVYRDGKKESLGNENTVPNYIVFEPSVLKTLPIYQKKCTMLDALCQACESWWNVHRTEESIAYSKEAITLIMANRDAYIQANDEAAAASIMRAANLSGKAINITATTAAHAMSYKLTSMYHLPHGHAVGICFPEVWQEMLCELTPQDRELSAILDQIVAQMGYASAEAAIAGFRGMLEEYGIACPVSENRAEDIEVLTASVNPVRLKNHPIAFETNAIRKMYQQIVK